MWTETLEQGAPQDAFAENLDLEAPPDYSSYHNYSNWQNTPTLPASYWEFENFDFKAVIGADQNFSTALALHKTTGKHFSVKVFELKANKQNATNILREKEVLQDVNHPFISRLLGTSISGQAAFMIFDFEHGGDFFELRNRKEKFNEEEAKVYLCEIILALEYLHSQQILFRNLKAENVLLDSGGHIKLVDFSFAKKQLRSGTLCGTPDYLAPEILQGHVYDQAVDWWALGIFTFELLLGYSPFAADNQIQTYRNILQKEVKFPAKNLSTDAKDFIKQLLVKNPQRRLGHGEDVTCHHWLKNVDWDNVLYKRSMPIFIPQLDGDGDTRYYDKFDDKYKSLRKMFKSDPVSEETKSYFEGF